MAIENTDLERRVLAHERILQTLIAHMAETEPKFLERLRRNFGPEHPERLEHDYVDTASYAEQFVRAIVQLKDQPVSAASSKSSEPPHPEGSAPETRDPELVAHFRVAQRAGIWTVTRNNIHYGDYTRAAPAIAAAQEGVRKALAAGKAAEFSPPAAYGRELRRH